MYGGTLTKEMLEERASKIVNILQVINEEDRRKRLESELRDQLRSLSHRSKARGLRPPFSMGGGR